jgi:hypothetical protein
MAPLPAGALAMMSETNLIAAIYDCVIDPSGWDDVVKRIVEATKSLSGGVFVQIHFDRTRLAASYNIDPFYADAYVQTYYKISPFEAEAGRDPDRLAHNSERSVQSVGVLQ